MTDVLTCMYAYEKYFVISTSAVPLNLNVNVKLEFRLYIKLDQFPVYSSDSTAVITEQNIQNFTEINQSITCRMLIINF